jgi:hypothetical protein
MVEPRQAAPLAGLIGLAVGLGFSGLLLIYAVIRFSPDDRQWRRFVTINGFAVLLLGLCLMVWLKSWRRIRRQSATVRWWFVVGCWGLSLIDLVIFTIKIR